MRRVVLLPLLLVGCGIFGGDKPPIESPAPPGVSYRLNNGDFAELDKKASDYCRQWGKSSKRGAQKGEIVSYECT